MTKCIVIGEHPTQGKKKPIEFVKFLCDDLSQAEPICAPKEYKFIELIQKRNTADMDVMFAHDGNRGIGTLYLGNWNDGVAE